MFDYTFQWRVVWKHWPELLDAGLLTLQLTLTSIIVGLMIASVLATFQDSKNLAAKGAVVTWVGLSRNTPVLLQIYLAYFGLGAFGIHLSPYMAVLMAVTFNNAGYLTEIIRGGMSSVPVSQKLAARGLGLTGLQTYIYIILPQVLRAVFLPIINQLIWAMLATSVGMIIGLQELTGMTTFLQSQTFRPFEFYFVAACMYFVIAKIATSLSHVFAAQVFKGGAVK